ncbi:MAG: site-specific integrase [Pseudomonadota bacterium]
MSVYKPKKSNIWQYDFQFKGNRYHGSTGCTNKRDAQRYEAEERRKAALGEEVKPSITIDEACGAWYLAKGQYTRSAATVSYQLENLANGLGANAPLHDLTLRDLDRYIAVRRAKVANSSVNREIALLRRVRNWCSDRGYDVPDLKWGSVRLKEPPVKTRVLSHEEERRLFEVLPDSLKPLVRFALISGQRKSEIVTLRWSDVDLGAGRATVSTKGDQLHTFPLTPELTAIIANQPKICPQVFTYVAERSSPRRPDRVQRIKGERYPFSKQGWNRKWRKALKDAGIDNFRFHDTRHTALTRTGSIEVAQKLADHSDIRTTRRYFHTSEDDIREAMSAAESRNNPEPLAGHGKKPRKISNER